MEKSTSGEVRESRFDFDLITAAGDQQVRAAGAEMSYLESSSHDTVYIEYKSHPIFCFQRVCGVILSSISFNVNL